MQGGTSPSEKPVCVSTFSPASANTSLPFPNSSEFRLAQGDPGNRVISRECAVEQRVGAAEQWEDSTPCFQLKGPLTLATLGAHTESGSSPGGTWGITQSTTSPASSHPPFLSPWVFPILSDAALWLGGHMTLAVWS